MKTREFREIQVSSTQLAIIFLGILIIGVVIFLLGVSVGKKHAQVAVKANVIAQKEAEPVKEKIATLPSLKGEQATGEEPGGKPAQAETESTPAKKEILPERPKAAPAVTDKKAPPPSSKQKPSAAGSQYFVQVAALAERPSAQSTAQKFRDMGYSVVVLDPQPSDRTPVFRVRVGGFATREEAEETRSKLTAAAGRRTDYFIVRD